MNPARAYITFVALEGLLMPALSVFPAYFLLLGLNPAAAGALLGFFWAVKLAATFFGGKLLDRLPANRAFALMYFGFTLTAGAYLTGNPYLISVALTLDGLLFSLSPAYRAYEHFAFREDPERWYARLYFFGEGLQVLFYAAAAGFLLAHDSLSSVKWLLATMLVVNPFLGFYALTMPEPDTYPRVKRRLGRLPRSLYALVFADFLTTTALSLGIGLSAAYIVLEKLGAKVGWVLVLDGAYSAAGALAGWLFPRTHLRGLSSAVAGVALDLLSTPLIFLGIPGLVAFYLLDAVSNFLWFTGSQSAQMRLVPPESRGSYYGLQELAEGAGSALGRFLAGILISALGFSAPYWARAGLLAIAGGLYIIWMKTVKSQRT